MSDTGQSHQVSGNPESIETSKPLEPTDPVEPIGSTRHDALARPLHQLGKKKHVYVWQCCGCGQSCYCGQCCSYRNCCSCGHRCSCEHRCPCSQCVASQPPAYLTSRGPRNPFHSLAQRCWRKITNKRTTFSTRTLPTPARTPQNTIFRTKAPVAIYGVSAISYADMEHAVIIYDTGCDYDLISTGYMRSRRDPEYARSRQIFAISITGAPFRSEGEVRIRWEDENYTNMRLMSTTCRIVKSNHFDIIIGRVTLERLELFVRNLATIGPVITPPPPPEVLSESDKQVRDAQRAQELKEQEEREREKGA